MSVFRIAYVPGVMPDKWLRTWRERHRDVPLEASPVDETEQRLVLDDGRAEMAFVRLPVDQDGLHLIPLYVEKAVVVVPKDHPASAYDELAERDIADELRLQVGPDLTARHAVETVAAGTGVVVLPMSVARLHHRKDVAHVVLSDVPGTRVGLAWLRVLDDSRVEDFIGIVRGRTARSSRGPQPAPKRRR